MGSTFTLRMSVLPLRETVELEPSSVGHNLLQNIGSSCAATVSSPRCCTLRSVVVSASLDGTGGYVFGEALQ